MLEWSIVIVRRLQVFYSGLQQNFSSLTRVPHVNRGDTPESRWMLLKVGLQDVLFLAWTMK